MNFINLNCPPLPYFIVGGGCVYRPGDIHERRTIRNVFDLIYVHSGTLYLEQDPFRVELNAGQFFIITPDTPHRGSREKESIARTLRDYLDAHYTEEISLNDLARQYSYSPSHLIRSFHQAYGASPMQYLKKLRIEHASQLLLHSDATIQSVGEMVGLRIPSYFIRVFKQEIGITPAQYRMFYAEENGGSEAP